MVRCAKSAQQDLGAKRHRNLRLRRIALRNAVVILTLLGVAVAAPAQTADWQSQVRRYAEAQDWASAMRIVEQQIARNPQDADVLAWRARILTWSGHLQEAETQYLKILEISRKDPDIWLGLANVYVREGQMDKALRALDTAVELDPKRADLHAARARALSAAGERKEGQREFQRALLLDPGNSEARAGLRWFDEETRHELRFGEQNDLFNFTAPNHDEWVSLMSRWNRHWTTLVGSNAYQRGGLEAGKFVGSVTGRAERWGALTVGGAAGHDNAVIPKSEAFFDLDHGWKSSEAGAMRGFEFAYTQHWYWYQAARILTLSGTAVMYFPREWTLSAAATGARSGFSGTGVEWRPSGVARLGFPLTHWNARRLTASVFFAAGSEDFAQVDQIGRFASQTYGGGLRFQLTAKQDLTGYASYQRRTQGRTDTNFGFSYGIRF